MPSKPAPARRIPDSPRARWTVRRVGAALVTCALTAAVAAGCTTLPQPPGGAAATIGPPASRTWTFPLLTTKAAIRRGSQTATGQFEKWCYTSLTNCHHDYNAADIMAPTGTPVLSPVSGVVVMTRTAPSNNCMGLANHGDQISIKGDDGYAYYLGHFLMGSLRVKTRERVTSGERIAQVGTIGNAQCTVPHLHIQQNPAGDYGGRNSFNIQPILVKSFQTLPS